LAVAGGAITKHIVMTQTPSSGANRGLSQGQSLAEGSPLVTVGGPLAKTQKKVKK